ncbi:hypothetical protein Droror1_Dr00001158 [Drosera rotundifolia]
MLLRKSSRFICEYGTLVSRKLPRRLEPRFGLPHLVLRLPPTEIEKPHSLELVLEVDFHRLKHRYNFTLGELWEIGNWELGNENENENENCGMSDRLNFELRISLLPGQNQLAKRH